MKSKTVLSIVVLSLLLSSCLVNSLHPFYDEKSIFFDEEFLGKWLDQDSTKWTIKKMYFSYGKGDQKEEYKTDGYAVRYSPKSTWMKNENKKESPFAEPSWADFDVFLFKINNQLYADFTPTMLPSFETWGYNSEFSNLHRIRTHTLAKVVKDDNGFELIWFNGLWLAELIENNRIKISHEFIPFAKPYSRFYKGQYVLTASTSELQSFIKKYGNDPNAFVRKREPLNEPRKAGKYTWNVGADQYSGDFDHQIDSTGTSYNYILTKFDDNKN